ncbi:protein polybromo isoform X4 [Oratosquilla oratoria]|uniref:protein polybromo isoform X4 n=1 Tax=Oratosquilla oratoria TaxID=337810 RepID=UPI003F75B736
MSAESAGMPKRKRVSENEDSQTSLPEGRPKRRRNDTTLRGRPPRSAIAMSAPMVIEKDGNPMTVENAVEELYGAVMTAMDPDGRLYSYDFRFLPSREKYPDYYEVIETPIDLKLIAQRIQAKNYSSLDDIEKDFNLVFNNACQFNEPGSRIFKDARTLKKLVQLRKADLLQVLNANSSVRLRSKRCAGNKLWSELMCELEDGMELPLPEEEGGEMMAVGTGAHDEEDSDDEVDMDNPQWQLFQAVKSLTSPTDHNYQLIEPFRRLPNRRWHADYYIEIKNPISLSQIRKKIVKGDYRYISDMVEDFNLMFDNAQQYNRPDSRIYRDAVKLQKFVQTKAEELAHLEEEESDSECDELDDSQSGQLRRKFGKVHRPLTFRRRAKILFKTLMDYMTEDGRQPIIPFIEKPSAKDYPDYYDIITHPVDMESIESKIKGDKYANEEELVADIRLMFNNCRVYNEEGSAIFEDAKTLERVVFDKIRELNQVDSPGKGGKPIPGKPKKYSQLMSTSKNIKLLYNTVRDYRDSEGRQLSEVFMKLPSKSLYPDYYEVIKEPIDLEKILHRWKSATYNHLDDILQDLTLMFQNACRYNEPESQIYRDALTLQRLALQKRLELSTDEDGVPHVVGLVQELLMSLFISVFNHEDENGRYTAGSFSDLPDNDGNEVRRTRVISFDIMKRRLDKGLYKRLDHFQDDLFSVLERVRRLSKMDSQTYQDSITLQTEYLKVRDELCNNGSILQSPALSYTDAEFNQQLNKAQGSQGTVEDGNDTSMDVPDEDSKPVTEGANSSMSHNQIKYYVGDFVYVDTGDKNTEYPIVHIERLWTNSEGKQMLYGCHYYRPPETFHVSTRKFYEQEVFKTDKHSPLPLKDVVGKCFVMSSLDYFKSVPEGFDNEDVYVCESRYNTKHRMFKKIKTFCMTPNQPRDCSDRQSRERQQQKQPTQAWPFSVPEFVKIIERPEPLEPKRVASIFKECVEKHKEELAELEEETKLIRRDIPNIVQQEMANNPSGYTYYEQYNTASGVVKRGDFVYVKGADSNKKSIRQITQIWTTKEGTSYFVGTVFTHAVETNPSGERLFYKQELYLTANEETLPVSDILGRCSVLDTKAYCRLRITEITEEDVFVCESFLDEMNKRVSQLQNGLRKFTPTRELHADEIYFFRRVILIHKYNSVAPQGVKKGQHNNESSPMVSSRMEVDFEDSMDGPPPSVASVDSGVMGGTPKALKKMPSGKQFQQMTGKKQMTGYILFSAEIRKSITLKNPNANFGEISRLVGIEWKCLPEPKRKVFEDRAHQMNLESAERALNGTGPESPQTPSTTTSTSKGCSDHSKASYITPHGTSSSTQELPLPNNPDTVFECMWESCDFQFEDLADLSDHLMAEGTGHIHVSSKGQQRNAVYHNTLTESRDKNKRTETIKDSGGLTQPIEVASTTQVFSLSTMYSKRKRKSPVWTYMEQTGSNIVTCTICKGTFAFTGTTSGLLGHLKTRHSTEYFDLTNIETPDWPPPLASSQSAKSESLSLTGPSQPGPSQLGPSQPGPSSRVISAAPRQQALECVITRRQPYPDGSEKKKNIDSHLLKLIVTDMQPLSLVENKGFQEFVKVIDPCYVLPSRRELMQTHFPSLYEKQKQQVREELEGASYVALTSDLWTSRQTKSFLSVTAHFISPEWELKCKLLATKRLMVDHTSKNIGDAIKEICEEWDLLGKVCCIVTDNAPNIVKAVTDVKVNHITCFAHSLNLVVQNALKNTNDVKKIQEKVKAIVSFFHHSVKASDMLCAQQVQQGGERKKLIMDMETRWNSTFDMFERFQEQHEAVTLTLCMLGRNNMCLSGDELECLSKAICVLEPFDVVTKELLAEKTTCLSKVIPLIKALRSCMYSTDEYRRELYETFPLGVELGVRLDRKFLGLEREFIPAVGTLLDPRFKKLHFVDKGNINEVQERLINSMRARSDSQAPVPAPATQAAQHQRPTQPKRQLDLWGEHDKIVKECLKAVQPTCVGPNLDMRRYLEEGIIARHEDPLRWWKNHSQAFPLLQDKAKYYFCIPATSVPSERVFSRAGELFSNRRNCLSDENVNMLLFLNKNMN